MTVSSATSKVQYNGNGSTTVFAYTFKVFNQNDLTVIVRSAAGTETVKTITTHYTVSGVGSAGGGNVTMLTAPTATETITILREQDLTQELDLVENDPFPAQSLEDALDKLTFMVQQHSEEIDRSIKASRTNTITSTEFTVSAASRANKIFAFDSSGELAVTQELGTYRGNWATATAFAQRDLIKDTSNNNIYICVTAHTSTGSQPISSNADVAKWALIVDASSATTSASAAASSASAASTSATNASNSASAAAGSASAASGSASAASSSETNAAASAASAAASYDSFDDQYLGPKSSNPTLDNDGNALLTGALYFNTVSNEMRVYTGSAWVAAYVSLGSALLSSNNLSDLSNAATALGNLGLTATAAELNYTDGVTSAIQTQLDAKAPLASPALTGVPTAPTAANGTDTTQIATTAFVLANAPVSGNQTFTAVGSIAAGSVVVASPTANSVETIGIMTNGQTNGSLQNYGSSTGAAGFYNHGRPCPMTSNTFIQARVSTTSPYPISAAVVTVAADGTLTTGTFATAVAAASYNGLTVNYVMKISTDKFIIFYATGAGANIYAVVGTVSGTTITFGTPAAVQATSTFFVDAATNGAGQVLVYCTNGTSPYASKVVALTISGTTITVGSAVTFYSLAAYANNNGSPDLIAYDPIADRYFVVWAATTAAGSPIYGGVFSVSGTTVTTVTTASLGSELVRTQLSTPAYYARSLYVKYVPSIGRMALIIGPTTTNELFVSTVLVSTSGFTRNTLSLSMGATDYNAVWSSNTGEIIVFPTSSAGYSIGFVPTTYQPYKISMGLESLTSGAIPYNALGNGYYVGSVGAFYVNYVMAVTNATKAIGLANATVTNGQSLSVAVTGGLCSSLSGLTSGNVYYVTGKGVVTQDNSAIKFIGTAVSTTSMLVGI